MERTDAATLLIELTEKMGLLAAAALVAVLFPPLRNRLLGLGRRRDKLAAVVLGLGLSAWGAMLGLSVGGEHINVRAIGVLIAAILGGWKAGAWRASAAASSTPGSSTRRRRPGCSRPPSRTGSSRGSPPSGGPRGSPAGASSRAPSASR
ncbi:MAG: hypothetical protein M5U28_00370 [Sandaracinaceae bacterium]|nr:hypothetical protein [Sandaracinaceae bacterium]